MHEYDASDLQIRELQNKLARYGVTENELDLGNYAGLTYRQLSAIVNQAIEKKQRSDDNACK